jgi:Zn-dependent peptidase ImmA (M78 family)
MKVKINNTKYTIKEVTDIHNHVEVDEEVWGATVFSVGMIFLEKNLVPSVKRSTLIHELTHAYLMEYGANHEHKSVEEVCDIMGAYADNIVRIADRYFGGKNV